LRVVIVGCGRLGAILAGLLDEEGHHVTIVDVSADSFSRLNPGYGGRAILGLGIDEDILRSAGIERADAFVALTDGDNTNLMASQIAKHVFSVPIVMCQQKDTGRGEVFSALGIMTVSPTAIGAEAIQQAIRS
jgi:trk system potassium uptake protein TrkA